VDGKTIYGVGGFNASEAVNYRGFRSCPCHKGSQLRGAVGHSGNDDNHNANRRRNGREGGESF
jgi:hypothetical protein